MGTDHGGARSWSVICPLCGARYAHTNMMRLGHRDSRYRSGNGEAFTVEHEGRRIYIQDTHERAYARQLGLAIVEEVRRG